MVDCRERHQSGNIFFALFGVVALIGVLGAGVMTFIKGPLTTSVNLTKSNATENSMQIAAQVAVMSSATSAGSGDCDSDNTIEPIEWRTPTTQPYPTGGGLIPLSLGTKTKDSWGTEFGYCVWNHGSTTSGSGCGANLLAGTNSQSYPVVALVSAGPDKTFTTTCRSFAAADVNSDGDLADSSDLNLVSEASSHDDDIIYLYSYEEAMTAAGGLWGLKSTDPDAATISKDIEVTGDANSTGTGSFSGGILLPDTSEVTCDPSTAGVMARSSSGTGIELCDGTSWQLISGDASCSSSTVPVPTILQSGWEAESEQATVTESDLSNFTAGSQVLVFATVQGCSPATDLDVTIDNGGVTDSAGNVYTKLYEGSVLTSSYPCKYRNLIFGANNSTSGPVTVSVSQAGDVSAYIDSTTFSVVELTGGDVSAIDVSDGEGYDAGATSVSLSTSVTNYSNELSFFYNQVDTTNSVGFVPQSGWTTDVYQDTGTNNGSGGDGVIILAHSQVPTSSAVTYTQSFPSVTFAGYATLVTIPPVGATSCPSSTLPDIQLQDQTVNATCDATNLGLLRYNTAGTTSSMTKAGVSGGSGSSISYVGSSVGYVGGSGTLTVNVSAPAGIQAGDLLLYVVNSDGADYNNMTWPSGFTAITGGNSGSPDGQDWAVAYKIATGSEGTLSLSDTNCYGITASVLAYRGVDTSTPIHQYSTAVGSNSYGNTWTVSANSVTPTVDGTQLVWIGAGDPDGYANGWDANGGSCPAVQVITHTPPSGYTERIDIQGNGVDFTCFNPLSVADMSQATAAATGTVSGTATSLVSGQSRPGAMLLSIRPLSSGGGGSAYSSAYTSSNYVEVCDGTSWTVVGRNALNDLTDVITNYTGSETDSSRSLYSMFLGDGSGINAASLSQYNTALGYQSMYSLMSGEGNTAMGYQSLYSNTIGDNNTAFGASALYTGVTASNNSAFGYNALYANAADGNTGFGSGALYSGGAKYGNTALGYWAMYYADSTAISSAAYNTAIGYQSLMGSSTAASNTGTLNTALGYAALTANTAGSYNSAAGYGAMQTNTTGLRNTALGYESLYSNVGGSDVTAIGYQALRSNTASENTALGAGALYSGAARTGNTAVGYNAMYYASNSTTAAAANNTAIGGYAMYGSSASNANSDNTAVGAYALLSVTTGSYNTAAGAYALRNLTVASNNTAAGYYAASSLRRGSYNTAIGYEAMRYIYSGTVGTTNGSNNTAVGYWAFRGNSAGAATNTANNNVAVGYQSFVEATTATQSVAVGRYAGYANTTGTIVAIGEGAIGEGTLNAKSGIGVGGGAAYNQRATAGPGIGVGYAALYSSSGTSAANDNNIAIGYAALYSANASGGNVAIGYSALYQNSTGNNNTAVGYGAGYLGSSNITGSTNTYIGFQASGNNVGHSNGMALGENAILTASNRVVLGNSSIASIYAQVTSITAISDGRRKKDVEDLDLGLSFINTLYPVSYRYNNGDDTLRYGFIAQDMEKALPDKVKPLVNKNTDGLALLTREETGEKTYRVNLGEMIAPLVKAVQELDKKFEALADRFESFVEKTKVNMAALFDDEKKLQAKREMQDQEIAELEAKIQGLKLSCVATKEAGHD